MRAGMSTQRETPYDSTIARAAKRSSQPARVLENRFRWPIITRYGPAKPRSNRAKAVGRHCVTKSMIVARRRMAPHAAPAERRHDALADGIVTLDSSCGTPRPVEHLLNRKYSRMILAASRGGDAGRGREALIGIGFDVLRLLGRRAGRWLTGYKGRATSPVRVVVRSSLVAPWGGSLLRTCVG